MGGKKRLTNDEAINVLKNTAWLGWGDKQKETVTEAVQMAVDALKVQLSKEDATSGCISRQAALELGDNLRDDLPDDEQIAAAVMAHNEGIIEYQTKLSLLPSVQPDIIRCKDCKHRPVTNDNYDDDEWDCGFNIEFPDYKCPCRCEDGYYNRLPDDNWFCGNAERRSDG